MSDTHSKHSLNVVVFGIALVLYALVFCFMLFLGDETLTPRESSKPHILTLPLSALSSSDDTQRAPTTQEHPHTTQSAPKPERAPQKAKPTPKPTKSKSPKTPKEARDSKAVRESKEARENKEPKEAQAQQAHTSPNPAPTSPLAQSDTPDEDLYALTIKRILARECALGFARMRVSSEVALRFVILEDGSLQEAVIVRPSGYARFDEFALQTLHRAHKKFPKLESKRTITLTLAYTPKR